MMCGIDEAIEYIRDAGFGFDWMPEVVNRLDYHRNQAEGVKPKWHRGQSIKDYYTCGNCGRTVRIEDNFCAGCGYRILWDSVRCLTGLPLVDIAEKKEG